MKADIGNYTITSDATSYNLYERRTMGEKSKKAGEEYMDVVGYYPTLEMTLRFIPEKALMRGDAQGLNEVATEIRKYRELIEKYLKAS